MNYKKGYSIKPLKRDGNKIIFTDGTNEVSPSQVACNAYGYKYNPVTGTCEIRQATGVNLNAKLSNLYNKVLGRKNILGSGVGNSIIAG